MAIRKAQAKTSQKNNNNEALCNKHSSQLLQKKAPYTSSKKTMNTLLHAVSHNLCNSQPTNDSTVIILSFYGNNLKYNSSRTEY